MMIAGWGFWLSVAGILYVYLGYPLLVTLLAYLRRKPGPYSSITPGVTLIIAAYNEEEVIAQKLENSMALDYPSGCLQILVAADGSTDRTVEIVNDYRKRGHPQGRSEYDCTNLLASYTVGPQIELSYTPDRRGKMAAINQAVPRARHEIMVFSDANNWYGVETLRELVKPFSDPAVGAVSGAKHILQGDGALGASEGLYWKYESFLKIQETRLGTCTGVSGEILALRRSLFRPVPDGVINDDFSIALAVIGQGYRVVYAPRARSFERVSPSARDEVMRRARIVAGRYQAMRKVLHGLSWRQPLAIWQVISHKFLRPLVPFWMLLALLANLAAVVVPGQAEREVWPAVLALNLPWNWIFLFLQLGFYLLAWVGNRWSTRSGIGKLLYLPAFLANSNLAALLGLYRYLTGKQSAAWQRIARRKSDSI